MLYKSPLLSSTPQFIWGTWKIYIDFCTSICVLVTLAIFSNILLIWPIYNTKEQILMEWNRQFNCRRREFTRSLVKCFLWKHLGKYVSKFANSCYAHSRKRKNLLRLKVELIFHLEYYLAMLSFLQSCLFGRKSYWCRYVNWLFSCFFLLKS